MTEVLRRPALLLLLALLACGAVAMACAAWPLAVYAVTLASCGLIHVLVELRYVDQRFSWRIGATSGRVILGLLLVIVLARTMGAVGWSGSAQPTRIELAAVVLLFVAVMPLLRPAGVARTSLGVALVAGIAVGTVVAPVATLVVFAFLHNLTPVGFLAERLRGRQRATALTACVVAFGIIPAVLASGLPADLLAHHGWWQPDAAPFPIGMAEDHTGTFVPARWFSADRTLDLFTAAVYLQCLHYAVVIGVLPRLGAGDADARQSVIPWPAPRVFAVVVVVLAVVACTGFARDFVLTRRTYGVLAAVHAWVELPVLLLALVRLRPA